MTAVQTAGRRDAPLALQPVFPVLDSLRFVGALAVLTTHVAFQAGDYGRNGILGDLLARLDVGVAIFFALSGFLLSRPWLARAAVGAPYPSVRAYARKRFWRIYPVYVLAVVVAVPVVRGNDPGDPGTWLRALTMTEIYTSHPLPQGLTQMWSLAVEVSFYAVLPLLARILAPAGGPLRDRRVVAVLGGSVALGVLWHLLLGGLVDAALPGSPLLWLPGNLTWFMVGTGLALAEIRWSSGSGGRVVRTLATLGAMPGTCWALALGLLLVVATPLGGPTLLLVATPTQSLVKHLGYAVVAGLVVLSGVFARPGSRWTTAMSWGWLRHLGLVSYGVFCLHLVALDLARRALDHTLFSGRGVTLWVLTVVASLAAAELAYRLVERPGMRFGHTGLRRRGQVVDGSPDTRGDEAAPDTTAHTTAATTK